MMASGWVTCTTPSFALVAWLLAWMLAGLVGSRGSFFCVCPQAYAVYLPIYLRWVLDCQWHGLL
ncbi:hypothetical protein F5144DRAFT_582026, partial [Chaetomium tenue]